MYKQITDNQTVALGDWLGGSGITTVAGTFGGGAAQLQFRPKDYADNNIDTWLNVGDPLTVAGQRGFTEPAGELRCVVSGATSPALHVSTGSVQGYAEMAEHTPWKR